MADIVNSVKRDINHLSSLFRIHPGKRCVIMNAGIVYQHLNGALFQDRLDRHSGSVTIGDIKTDCLSRTSSLGDPLHLFVSTRLTTVSRAAATSFPMTLTLI